MRCRCRKDDVLPCDIDASEEFRDTGLGRSIEAVAYEIVLLEQTLTNAQDEEDRDSESNGWERFRPDELISFIFSDDATAIISALERMVERGLLLRDEEGYLHVQPVLLEALVRYIQ